jgi:hypothetical protein
MLKRAVVAREAQLGIQISGLLGSFRFLLMFW